MTGSRLLVVGGGQSGLAAARVARDVGMEPVVLEAGPEPVGSWPGYYDSLRLFSPSEYSGFPDYGFPGHHGRYPTRDEVVEFLRGYANWLAVDVRTDARVDDVTRDGAGLVAHLHDGSAVEGDAVVAASGSFANPYRPAVPGQGSYRGRLLHVAAYRSPATFAGQRVVVVGAGNSAIQVGYELAEVAETTLAVRSPVQFTAQVRGGRDIHYWLDRLQLDRLPPAVLSRLLTGTLVIDTGRYQAAVASGRLPQRQMFTSFTDEGVVWADGDHERVDAVILATGYRPHLPYLAGLGALGPDGAPRHVRGLSTTEPRLAYLGLEFQRSFSSNTLRGVHRDASYVVTALASRRRRSLVRG
ncbi:flavin-containing monooxygenase [Nocardioides sp. SYSU DS0651]|uniref:flavin-containing monooxygenase n=1 Tax=Nocardioides sp. SYSU DS0651 TaxID=3415955 RepID=UPI003F4C2A0C